MNIATRPATDADTDFANRAIELYRRLGFREYDRTNIHVLMEWKEKNILPTR